MIVTLTHPRISEYFLLNPTENPNDLVLMLLETWSASKSFRTEINAEDKKTQRNEILLKLVEIQSTFDPIKLSIENGVKNQLQKQNEDFKDILQLHNTGYVVPTIQNFADNIKNTTQILFQEKLDALKSVLAENVRNLLANSTAKNIEEIRNLEKLVIEINHNNDPDKFARIIQIQFEGLRSFADGPIKVQEKMANLENLMRDLDRKSNPCLVVETIGKLSDKLVDMNVEFREYFGKTENSSAKGIAGENQLQIILNDLFPSGEIIRTANTSASCDFLLCRPEMSEILFETKTYAGNVPKDEVTKFLRDVGLQKKHAIFLSQKSGICNKADFQIEIHNNCVLIYLHRVNFCPQKIGLAVKIVDILGSKLLVEGDVDTEHILSLDQLEDLNREYELFQAQKNGLLLHLRENLKQSILRVNAMEFSSLDRYLRGVFSRTAASRDTLSDETSLLTCNVCENFHTTKKRSLTLHSKNCLKKRKRIEELKAMDGFVPVNKELK